ncbi:MAG: CCA tRNA nucleotidyltransferase [Candidatus Omnitrophica bacterium]|nr:CCA tRNA nucleotidyltransferase [Candidatus Omnitrophota bacterium]
MKRVGLTLLPRNIQDLLRQVSAFADTQGVRAYLVGGMVRDLLLGMQSTDIDIVVEGDACIVARHWADKLGAELSLHEKFRTAALTFKDGLIIDVVTARRETYARGGALPDIVPSSLKDDILRRDFKINGMALGLNVNDFGILYDHAGGLKDLEAKLIRVLHSGSFVDDPTRILRAARYAVRFGFQLDALTHDLLGEAVRVDVFKTITAPRYFLELRRILEEKDPVPALDFLLSWDALRYISYGVAERVRLIEAGVTGWETRLGILLSGLAPLKAQEIMMGFNIPRPSQRIIVRG